MNEMVLRAGLILLILLSSLIPASLAQTTQGIITGRVWDSFTGQALSGAVISCYNTASQQTANAISNAGGFYAVSLLSPGIYSVRITRPSFLPRETAELWVFVAGRVDLNIPMRPASAAVNSDFYSDNVLPSKDIVHSFAEDLQLKRAELLETLSGQAGTALATLSYTIDAQQLNELPLSGRDAYTLIVTLPGVTTDNATARGLGLSVNGQRVSSSNFLLDGLENNEYVLTGPLTVVAPEAIQEYRVSTNNFSAEYGRTAGFVANAITRSGTSALHGLLYNYFGNAVLNANSPDRKYAPSLEARAPEREWFTGYQFGAPLIRDRLFLSSSLERFSNLTKQAPTTDLVPIVERALPCSDPLLPQTIAFLKMFPPPPALPSQTLSPGCTAASLSGSYTVAAPVELYRLTSVERLDYAALNKNRLMARVSLSRVAEPDFIYSVYPGLSSELDADSTSVAGSWVRPGKAWTNELKLGWRTNNEGWNRPHPETPTLLSSDGVLLPGSPAAYEYQEGGNYGEAANNISFLRGAHQFTAGAGALLLRPHSTLTFGRDGYFQFVNTTDFVQGLPNEAVASLPRSSTLKPDYARTYSENEFFGFIQDSWKVSNRLTLSPGLRYESFGAPVNKGTQDAYLQIPAFLSHAPVSDRLTDASPIYNPTGQRSIYRPDRTNWAPRFGIAYSPKGLGATVLRASYGIFFDRPFQALFEGSRNNDFYLASIAPGFYPALPITQAVAAGHPVDKKALPFYWIDENLRTPRVQSWFAGIQHAATSRLYFEVSEMGAVGRGLISTDRINRENQNASLPLVVYRGNQGSSKYNALAALARYHTANVQFQASYTYSHSIDNQSEPLLGDYFDLTYTKPTQSTGRSNIAAFSQEFNWRSDRGNSDFDQRHNLVFFGIWEIPKPSFQGWPRGLTEGWHVSALGAFRSGFPYTVLKPGASLYTRVNLVPGQNPFLAEPVRVPGGELVLNSAAFAVPDGNQPGNLGRNALIGPGFWNADASVSKTVPLGSRDSSRQIQFRADFFNALNHENLGTPNSLVALPGFGVEPLGRTGLNSAFPALLPLNESPRQIRLQLRVLF